MMEVKEKQLTLKRLYNSVWRMQICIFTADQIYKLVSMIILPSQSNNIGIKTEVLSGI